MTGEGADRWHRVAGWSSSVARWAHNPEVVGSNPAPATNEKSSGTTQFRRVFSYLDLKGQQASDRAEDEAEAAADDRQLGVEVGEGIKVVHGDS